MGEAATHEHRVLILAPTGEDTAVLSDALLQGGLTPCTCGSIDEICHGIDDISGTAIIAEEVLSPENIRRLAETIQRQPDWSDFPLIIMSSAGMNPARIWTTLSAPNMSFNLSVLERPLLTRTLLEAVRSCLRSRNSQYRVAEELRRRKEAENLLTIANEELQSFSYSASHDLRAPLRTMKGFCTIVLEDYSSNLDETGQDYLRRIIKSADQMGKLIDDMLSLAKISRQEMIVQDVNLSELVRTVIDEFRKEEPERQVEVIVQDNLMTRGDERLLRIVLVNILGNAWKYTSKTPNSRIEFSGSHKKKETIFAVRDNGAGFLMEHAEKLFKPFQRLHSEHEFTGTGIGLAIVNRVISRHGGRIWAEGEAGKGATFYFTLK